LVGNRNNLFLFSLEKKKEERRKEKKIMLNKKRKLGKVLMSKKLVIR